MSSEFVINTDLLRMPPEPHQLAGANLLLNNRRFLLGDTPGAGKTKQVIDAADTLFQLGEIDTVLTICPAQVRPAWLDRDFGEIAKHSFVPTLVVELTGRRRVLPEQPATLTWGVTSYELVRSRSFWRNLNAELTGRKLLIVLDESLALADTNSQQHKAVRHLVERHADYCWELNGTPGNPLQLYGQFEILDPMIIGVKNKWHFLARYAEQAPVSKDSPHKKIVGWINKDLFDRRVIPYTVRRVPPLSVQRSVQPPWEVRLPAEVWSIYKDLRKEALAELDESAQVVGTNSMTKILRLCQLTGGFVGGVEANPLAVTTPEPLRWLHDAKIKMALRWVEDRLAEDPTARMIIWARFTPELDRLSQAMREHGLQVWELRGGQTKSDRAMTLEALKPTNNDPSPGVCVGQPQAGGLGLTLTRAHDMLYYSSTFRWIDRDQTEGRIARKTQTADCRFWDLVAAGPEGQRTMDHRVLAAVRTGADVAAWTVSEWRTGLEDEA